jgi:hypothetical protein
MILLGRGHYLWRGVAPKRKGLGKQNFEWGKGWVNEKQNNSRCWRLNSNVNNHISIQYVNQSESLSWWLDHFPICLEAYSVSKESTGADNMKLYTAENCTSSYQTHVTEVLTGPLASAMQTLFSLHWLRLLYSLNIRLCLRWFTTQGTKSITG